MAQSKTAKRREQLTRATGTTDPTAQSWLINQLLNALYFPPDATAADKAEALEAVLVMLEGIAPRDAVEGMMAVQMVAIQAASMECLRRANAPLQSVEARTGYTKMAMLLSGSFARHHLALKRLRVVRDIDRRARKVLLELFGNSVAARRMPHP